jgi:putative phosphoesterase
MKLAILADIHSNLHALEAVEEALGRIDHDLVLCAGDIVGYGANPNECCARIREMADLAVFGNHELAVLTGDVIWMNPHAAKAAIWTSKVLSPESKEYLNRLELEARADFEGKACAMYHGSVGSAIQYVYEDEVDSGMLKAADCDLLILGHTHVPYSVRFPRGLAVNPGSVGQPRDGNPRASFALLDTKTLQCETKRIEYDTEGAWEAIVGAGLPDYLGERLLVGR